MWKQFSIINFAIFNVFYLSSKKEKARTHARIFEAYEQNIGPARSFAPPEQREKALKCLVTARHPMLMGFKHRVSLMLKKNNRITTAEFKKLGKPIRVLHTAFFSVRLHTIANMQPKFAIVVSKKVAQTAVERNLLRRRLYELFGKNAGDSSGGIAVVVFVKKEAIKATFRELKDSFSTLSPFPRGSAESARRGGGLC